MPLRRRLTGPFRRHPGITTALVLLLVAATAVAFGAWRTCGFDGCPDTATLTAFQPKGSSLLLDRNGEPFAELTPLERKVVPLDDLPAFVPEAFVAVEDRRFYEHDGVDWVRLGGAVRANFRAGGVEEGGSTITMQLTRNLFPERIPAAEESVKRKLLEMRVARAIEDRFSKREILELYLNHIYFGHGQRGIEAASRYYFGHAAAELELPEAALLAALPKAPAHYDPREDPEAARQRRNLVLELMAEQGRMPRERTAEAEEAPLGVVEEPPSRREEGTRAAPYFAAAVRRELEERLGDRLGSEPVRVWTTLDLETQRDAEEQLRRRLEEVERNVSAGTEDDGPLQAALVILDAEAGDVLAWVGGRDYEQSQFDRVSKAQRQPGSAFKPFVLAAALLAGHSLSEVLADQPLTVEMGDGRTWSPANFENRYAGEVTVREALVHSKNVAVVRLLQEVGTGRVVSAARRLGIEPPIPETPSIALGAVEVSPLELAAAYTPFATLGQAVEPRLVLRVEREDGTELWSSQPQSTRVLEPAVAWLVTDVLSEVVRRGTGTAALAAGIEGAVAGKTGTTNDNTDAWFVGFTPRWVGAVWVGFDTPRSIGSRATGGRIAAPLWGRVMAGVQDRRDGEDGEPPAEWRRPAAIVERAVDPSTGFPVADGCRVADGNPRQEVFLAGAVPRSRCPEPIRPRWRQDRYGYDRTARLGDEEDPLLGFGDRPGGEEQGERGETAAEIEQREREWQELLERRREEREAYLEQTERDRRAGESALPGGEDRTGRDRRDPSPAARDEADRPQRSGPGRATERAEPRRQAPGRSTAETAERDRSRSGAAAGPDGTPTPTPAPDAGPASGPDFGPDSGPDSGPEPGTGAVDPNAAPDLGGAWRLRTRITESDAARYEGLTLGFRIRLRQQGNQLTGSGQKVAEGGEALPAGRRTAIRVSGSVDGREVRLRFSEEGPQRASGGSLWLRLSEDGSILTGRFVSDAASSRGSARLDRLR